MTATVAWQENIISMCVPCIVMLTHEAMTQPMT